MSESTKFGYLKDRQAAADSTEPEAVESVEPEAVEGSQQFGRRADPRFVQISVNVPTELRRQFRMKLLGEDRTMQEVTELLIDGYLSGDFKV